MDRNFKRKLVVGLFAPVLGLAVGGALAQATPSGSTDKAPGMSEHPAAAGSWNAQTFDLLDKNKDGQISREEAQANPALLGAWSKLDVGNRGSVSKEDFEKFRASQSGAAPK